MRSAVLVEGVSRSFVSPAETVWAVRDGTFEVARGSFVCLFGASGSGKSTLLNLLAGLDSATTGVIRIGASEIGSLSEDQRSRLRLERVGVVFQDHNLIEEFTAAENVMLPLEVLGRPVAAARVEAEQQLSRVGLAGLAGRFPAQLSGGQRQRVGIARALVGDRELLLADEPTGALDSRNSRALFELFSRLCHEGMTVIVATHELMAREFADVVLEMVDGRPVPVPATRSDP